MPGITAIENLLLQGNLDAGGFTIINLDLAGLGLTKSSVGLGNVDNTSDLDKPISNAVGVALGLKEDDIAYGTADQFWKGDKTWQDFGSLALQNGITTLPLLTVIGAGPSSNATLMARRNDYGSSLVNVSIKQFGASVLGNVLTGLPAANVGMLDFDLDSFGVIRVSNANPLVFGMNGIQRMRLQTGLNVGGTSDPGAGNINATNTVFAAHFSGAGDLLTGITKDQIPGTLNATIVPRLIVNGVGGNGYVSFASQSADPVVGSCIYATSLARIALKGSINPYRIEFATDNLSANRIWAILDATGTVPVIVAAPASAGAPGKANSIALDSNYLYVCPATDTWRRIAHNTWP